MEQNKVTVGNVDKPISEMAKVVLEQFIKPSSMISGTTAR